MKKVGLDRELGALANTRGNLRNIAAALEMYAADHEGQFPPDLSPLLANYLREIPVQLDGSKSWNYEVRADGFRLSERWPGFRRLGLPERVSYDSRTGLDPYELPPGLAVIGPEVDLEGNWLRRSGSPGLSASWERFELRISVRLRGPATASESFAQLKERAGADLLRWGCQVDSGDFARALPASVKPGWTLEGLYAVAGAKTILLSRGERLLEITVEDRQSRDALGAIASVRSLLAQL